MCSQYRMKQLSTVLSISLWQRDAFCLAFYFQWKCLFWHVAYHIPFVFSASVFYLATFFYYVEKNPVTRIKLFVHRYSQLSLSQNSRASMKYFEKCVALTYQICRIEEKENPTTTFHKYVTLFLKLEIYWKYCGKEEKLLLLRSNFS